MLLRAGQGGIVRALLQVVVQRRQVGQPASPHGQRQQVVGQRGVLGEQRAVQVGTVDRANHAALQAVVAVVAVANLHAAERRPAVQVGAAPVVLEADQPLAPPAHHHVAGTALGCDAGMHGV